MPVTSVEKDLDRLSLTIVADFAAPVQRVWDAYMDPRKIEKFWGPPQYPATFTRHDAAPGGRTNYVMTGPDGSRHCGYWDWVSVDAPHLFEVQDGFAHADGTPNTDLPQIRMTFAFEPTGQGSRMTTTSIFSSADEWNKLDAMGMEEGTRSAMAQIDAVLADLAAFSANLPAEAQLISDTQVRVARVIRGTVDQVWRAHHQPELMKRWLLGPDGWSMPVCEIAQSVGDTYRYEWEQDGGEARFGFTGELLESVPPVREVTSEAMIGADYPPAHNELTLTPLDTGTLLSLVITYADKEMRDMVLATGMTDGMETSYARLEQVLTAEPALL
jgi:uncharacterized protein YndB with AHSA1/START domain